MLATVLLLVAQHAEAPASWPRPPHVHDDTTHASVVPTLTFLSTQPLSMTLPNNTTSFEGGTVVHTPSGQHLFTTDTSRGIVNTSLVYYYQADDSGPFVFVRQIVCCSEGVLTGHRASLWAPMPVFDDAENAWRLFYVQYSSSIPASNKSGWFFNFDGQIASAISSTKGADGIGGPYVPATPAVVLSPGNDSQSWEGLQGTDSISPPFMLPDNKTWAAFYGSAQTEKIPRPHGIWWNGLATTSTLGQPFVRQIPNAKVDFNGGGSENPVVTYLSKQGVYVALFDDLFDEARGFGMSYSADGLTWATPAVDVPVPGGARTPMASILSDESHLSVYYTNYGVVGGPERVMRAEFELSFNLNLKTDDEVAHGQNQNQNQNKSLPRLVFEVGEGFTNSLVVSTRAHTAAGNFSVLDAQLSNIYQALLPLTASYTVDVLLSPCHLYNLTARGPDTPPLQRFHPGLLRFMQFFEAQGRVGVFLEAYSSGIVTQQVGYRQADCEPDCMPPTSLSGSPLSQNNPGYKGLSMDLQAVGALKAAYPIALVGVRFHEVYGCDSVWRSDGQKDCFQLAPEVFSGFIDLCAESGLIFFHNDNSALLAHDLGSMGPGQWSYHADRPAYYEARLLAGNTTTTVEYARAKLGKNALLTFENNNGFPTLDLAFFRSVVDVHNKSIPVASWTSWDWRESGHREFPLINRSRSANAWGLSNQPWAWSEWQHSMVGIYFNHGEMFAPVEFLVQYSLWAIERKADVIQFEPSCYFFDEFFLNQDSSAGLERPLQPGLELPSHKERISLRRLKAALLAEADGAASEDGVPMPSADLATVFDHDQQVFMSNRAAHPPHNYKQSQLLAASKRSVSDALDTVDFYSTTSGGRHYQMQPLDVPTFPAHVTANASALLGAEITGARSTRTTQHRVAHSTKRAAHSIGRASGGLTA